MQPFQYKKKEKHQNSRLPTLQNNATYRQCSLLYAFKTSMKLRRTRTSFASKNDLSTSSANDEWRAELNGVAFIHGALFPAQTALDPWLDAVSATAVFVLSRLTIINPYSIKTLTTVRSFIANRSINCTPCTDHVNKCTYALFNS